MSWEGGDVENCVFRFGRSDVGSLSVHVAHGGGLGVGSILLYLFGGELGPGVQVASVGSVDPSGEDRGEKAGMVESNAVAEMWEDGGISGGQKDIYRV